MKALTVFPLLLLIGFRSPNTTEQPKVDTAYVEKVVAKPSALSCVAQRSAPPQTEVTVVIVLEDAKLYGSEVKVSLFGSSSDPPGDRLIIDEPPIKTVTLTGRTTRLPYTVRCGPETVKGKVTLFAGIVEAPPGIPLSDGANRPVDERRYVEIQTDP